MILNVSALYKNIYLKENESSSSNFLKEHFPLHRSPGHSYKFQRGKTVKLSGLELVISSRTHMLFSWAIKHPHTHAVKHVH